MLTMSILAFYGFERSTNLYSGAGLKGDVYGLKVSITLSGAVYDSAHLPHG